MESLRLNKIRISDVGPFKDFELSFNGRYNLICGTNGIGKTSILNSIAAIFNGGYYMDVIRKNSNAIGSGSIVGEIIDNGQVLTHTGKIDAFLPDEQQNPIGLYNKADHIIYLNKNRDFQYSKLTNLSADVVRSSTENMNYAQRGIDVHDIKEWFVRRYLFEPHRAHWPDDHIKNHALAKRCFSLLDPEFELSHAHHASFEIFVNTPSGTVPFEFLSSGFRASLALLLGIIKEIEIRRLNISADEFSGLIMIDELDLHLHPTWQKSFPGSLKQAFPNAQFVVTTHSPHMIQAAEAHEVVALIAGDNGSPRRANFASSHYGFKGWTVEEILEDVMGMQDTTSSVFNSTMVEFEGAISADDPDRTLKALKKLELMLHPSSAYRKLIKIQAAPVVGAVK